MSQGLTNGKLSSTKVHLLVWLALVIMGVTIFSFYFPLRLVVVHAICNASLLAGLFYSCTWLVNKYEEDGSIYTGILIGLATFFVVNLIRTVINLELLKEFPAEMDSKLIIKPLWRVSALVVATSAFVAVFGIAFQLFVNKKRREAETMAILQAQQSAQLHFLKAQINPHFLFNALNNIYSLTVVQSKEAPNMLLRLSDLLRYVIYEGQKEMVSLEKEVQQVQNFIELFNMRSESPADIQFEVVGDISQTFIEPMILIPMVENCFKHADFDTNPKAYAKIKLKVKGDWVNFSTMNSFDPRNLQKDDTGGVGLENIKRRLALRHPSQHDFVFRSSGNVFEVNLALPAIR